MSENQDLTFEQTALMYLGMILAGERRIPYNEMKLVSDYLTDQSLNTPGNAEEKFSEFDALNYCHSLNLETEFIKTISQKISERTNEYPISRDITDDNQKAFKELIDQLGMLHTVRKKMLTAFLGNPDVTFDQSRARIINANLALLKEMQKKIDDDLIRYKINRETDKIMNNHLEKFYKKLKSPTKSPKSFFIINRKHKGRSPEA